MQKKIKSIYIIGIGGISLSAIAVFLRNQGYKIYGSDCHDSEIIHKLTSEGFEIKIGYAPNFVKLADAVVYTSAIDQENKDLLLAKKLGKPVFSRAEILGELSKKFKTISVAGTHGKTTTTGMISNIFLVSHKDPNIHIGGILKNINSNVLLGKSDILITEACEYKDSFLQLKNYISIVLNIKPDHLDYFKNFNNIVKSFEKFAQNTSKNGLLAYNSDDFNAKSIHCNCKKISFGLSAGSDLQAVNIVEYDNGKYKFDVYYLGKDLGEIKLSCFGKHNIYNALASIVVAIAFDINFELIKLGIESFEGIKRRFEYINKINGNLIIHDYAHHPDELNAVIDTCKKLGYKKVVAVFQPHTFSRTQALHDKFIKCFKRADEIWLLPIYPAREKKMKGVSSYLFCKDLKQNGQKAKYFSNFTKCKNEMLRCEYQNTLFAIFGAGDIENLANMLK